MKGAHKQQNPQPPLEQQKQQLRVIKDPFFMRFISFYIFIEIHRSTCNMFVKYNMLSCLNHQQSDMQVRCIKMGTGHVSMKMAQTIKRTCNRHISRYELIQFIHILNLSLVAVLSEAVLLAETHYQINSRLIVVLFVLICWEYEHH